MVIIKKKRKYTKRNNKNVRKDFMTYWYDINNDMHLIYEIINNLDSYFDITDRHYNIINMYR